MARNLIDVTPTMTSYTTPAPYAISSSGVFDATTNYQAWKIFNNNLTDAWVNTSGVKSGWVKIDFGAAIKVDAITMYTRVSCATEAPCNFYIYGSNDDITYEQIIYITDQTLWGATEGRLFSLPFTANYRYYKFNIISNNGAANLSIGEIRFWQNTIESITNIDASMSYGIAMNSTANIIAKENDNRRGLLGAANDGNNYGTLYMVNNIGKAQMVMGSLKLEKIWEGSAHSGTFTKTATNFKAILFIFNGGFAPRYELVPVDLIKVNGLADIEYTFATTSSFVYWKYTLTNTGFSSTLGNGAGVAGAGVDWYTNRYAAAVYGIY